MGEIFNGDIPEHRGLLVLARWMTQEIEPPLNDKELVRLADLCLKALTEELGRRARVQRGQLTGPEKCFPAGVTPRQLSEVNNRGWNLPSFP